MVLTHGLISFFPLSATVSTAIKSCPSLSGHSFVDRIKVGLCAGDNFQKLETLEGLSKAFSKNCKQVEGKFTEKVVKIGLPKTTPNEGSLALQHRLSL